MPLTARLPERVLPMPLIDVLMKSGMDILSDIHTIMLTSPSSGIIISAAYNINLIISIISIISHGRW
jgi:hypothetical protein